MKLWKKKNFPSCVFGLFQTVLLIAAKNKTKQTKTACIILQTSDSWMYDCMYKLCLPMLHIPTIKLTDIQLNERLVVQVK